MIEAFDRQLEHLLRRQYPSAAGIGPDEFVQRLESLRNVVSGLPETQPDLAAGKIPFVIVVQHRLVSTEHAMQQLGFNNKPGVISMTPVTPEQFKPIDAVAIPQSDVYLLVGIERGDGYRDITPADALEQITRANRSPLTLDEGIAILTQHPGFLFKNHCFSLLASRCGDRRVPALWISAGAAKLGWCWNGNPHTWLGSASCVARVAG